MAIYKNANLDISVAAEQNPSYNAKPSVQFSTQDKNTAKYTFTVKQNNKPVDLTDVTASVTLFSEDKSVFQSDATITSATEGKIEYVIPSEAIRHHGKTRGDLRLTYPNGDVLGGLRFTFNIEQALIDRAAGVVGGVYIRDFEQLKAEIEETVESIKDFDVARVDMELKEKATKEELNGVTAQLAEKVDEVTQEGSIVTFKSNGNSLYSFDLSVTSNANLVQTYIDSLVQEGQIEGVTLADGAIGAEKLNANLRKNINEIHDIVYEAKDKTVMPANANGIVVDQNTLEIPSTTSGGMYRFGNVVYENGKKYKAIVTYTNKSQYQVSVTPADVINGSFRNYYENTVVPANSTKTTEFTFEMPTTGTLDFRFACYTANINLQIKYRMFDITNMDSEMLSVIDLKSINTSPATFFFANQATYANESTYAKEAEKIKEKKRNITCFGDSLTEGIGGNGTNFPDVLATLTGVTVNNMGIGGETTIDILARQGGYPSIVNPFTIPSGTTAVEISYRDSKLIKNATPRMGRLGTKGINPVAINGVQGNISYSSTDSKYYFTRSTSGTAVEITRPTPVITQSSKLYKDDIQVIFAGTNGGWMATNMGEAYAIKALISQHNMMIDYSTSKKFIIIGMHYYYDWVLANGISKDNVEYALMNEYGRHYINLREYMLDWGLQDAGLTATEADRTAITNGSVPPSLLNSDKIHGNAHFYRILANLVYKRGGELGYW